MLPSFTYVRTGTVDDAVRELGAPGARIHAGGTDLLGCLHDGVLAAERLVSINAIDEMRGVTEQDGALRIGALTTVAELARSTRVRQRLPGLAQAAAAVASPQLRNQGTIGGNLCQKPRCWYYRGEFNCLRKGGDTCFAMGGENAFHCILGGDVCTIVHPSDTAPMLLALDARLEVAGPGGKRQLNLADLHVSPAQDPRREVSLNSDELITEVVIPASARGLRTSYRKVRGRQSWDFALAGVALALELEGQRVKRGRVVLSGVAPVPWRSRPAEQAIIGKTLDGRTIAAAARAAVEGAEPMSDNAYKIELTRALVAQQLQALSGG